MHHWRAHSNVLSLSLSFSYINQGTNECSFLKEEPQERYYTFWRHTQHNAECRSCCCFWLLLLQLPSLVGVVALTETVAATTTTTRSVPRWYDKDKTVILIKMQLKLSISSHKAEPPLLLLPLKLRLLWLLQYSRWGLCCV